MNANDKAMLNAAGWTVECESPLEVRHEDGSFATLRAVQAVIDMVKAEAEREDE